MKTSSIILGILLVLTAIALGLALIQLQETNSKLVERENQLGKIEVQIQTLNSEITSLTNNNIELYAKSHLKSFENIKSMERFLNSSETIRNSNPNGYASQYCIALMREARESGYWMGITAINSTDESLYDALARRLYGASNVHWYIYNVAIVGDADIYLVNPMEATDYHRLSAMVGDFAEYNKDTESNVSNLNIH